MKYCLKCGRGLFDKDIECDKCNSTDFISEKECKDIIREINSANIILKKILLKNPTYKSVFDHIINKPKDNFNYLIPNKTTETKQEYFDRINKHTINNKKIYTPKCPTCGSLNVRKIGTLSRMASVGFFGLGSSKLGKTMECKDCGYKW